MAGRRRSRGCTSTCSPPSIQQHCDLNFIGQSPLQWRSFSNRGKRLHHDKIHGNRNLFWMRTPGGEPECRVVPTIHRVGVQQTYPAPFVRKVFHRIKLPDMRRDSTNLNVDEVW